MHVCIQDRTFAIGNYPSLTWYLNVLGEKLLQWSAPFSDGYSPPNDSFLHINREIQLTDATLTHRTHNDVTTLEFG